MPLSDKQIRAIINQSKFLKDTTQSLITKLEDAGHFDLAKAYESMLDQIDINRIEVKSTLENQ